MSDSKGSALGGVKGESKHPDEMSLEEGVEGEYLETTLTVI
jgi:hypothetical protein